MGCCLLLLVAACVGIISWKAAFVILAIAFICSIGEWLLKTKIITKFIRETYTAYRYFKNPRRKPQVMKYNLSYEKAIEFCDSYPVTPSSSVGFKKDI